MNGCPWVLTIVFILFGVCTGGLIEEQLNSKPRAEAIKAMCAKAVELGAATWVIDPATGKTTFTWKDGTP